MKREMLPVFADVLLAARRVWLFTHVNPDGDTLGSALALRAALEAAGVPARVVVNGEVPYSLRFLPGADDVTRTDALAAEPNALADEPDALADVPDAVWRESLGLAVDVASPDRMGGAGAYFNRCGTRAQIDHHPTNPRFAPLNWVEDDAAATAVAAYWLIHEMMARRGLPIPTDAALCLYAAIATDTGNFTFQNTNADVFEVAASLMRIGLPLDDASRRLFREQTTGHARLLGRALETLDITDGGRLASMRVTRSDMAAAGASESDTDDIVNHAIDCVGVKIALFARETPDGRVKASLRSLPPYRVNGVAKAFSGGGHPCAAGCTLDMPLDQAAETLRERLRGVLNADAANAPDTPDATPPHRT